MIHATGIQPRGWVWQYRTHLFVLDRGQFGGWEVAEVEFLRDGGYYAELRRCSYEWPREAVGAMLGRLLATQSVPLPVYFSSKAAFRMPT